MKLSHSVEELNDSHLHCRTFGHGWDDDAPIIQTINPGTGKKQWNVMVGCNCGTTRTDELDQATLEVLKRTYTYPDGYLTSFYLDRKDARREWVARKNRVTSLAKKQARKPA